MNTIVQTLINFFGWQTIVLWALQHVLGTTKGLAAFQEVAPVIEAFVTGTNPSPTATA